jgi:hypothetical protein
MSNLINKVEQALSPSLTAVKERAIENFNGRKVEVLSTGSATGLLAAGVGAALFFGAPVVAIAVLAAAALAALVAFLATLFVAPRNVTVETVAEQPAKVVDAADEKVSVVVADEAAPVVTAETSVATAETVAPKAEEETANPSRFRQAMTTVANYVKAHPYQTAVAAALILGGAAYLTIPRTVASTVAADVCLADASNVTTFYDSVANSHVLEQCPLRQPGFLETTVEAATHFAGQAGAKMSSLYAASTAAFKGLFKKPSAVPFYEAVKAAKVSPNGACEKSFYEAVSKAINPGMCPNMPTSDMAAKPIVEFLKKWY